MNGNIKKVVTFSFDDGNFDDIRVIEILNKYGLKGTFNLNSSSLSGNCHWIFGDGKEVRHINYTSDTNAYSGHEIAAHGYTHPRFTELDEETLINEVALDKKLLSFLFGTPVNGMAYPFGIYNDTVVEALEKCGILYCRTVNNTDGFGLPENPLLLNPTCHFKCENVFALAEKFINNDAEQPQLFYIWGHSYELVTEEDWNRFEKLCEMLSRKNGIISLTNIEALRYFKVL